MSRKSIRKIEEIFSQEDVKGIKKDQESGKYRIVTQEFTREQNSGNLKSGKLCESEELYEICNELESETQFRYEDIDGAEMIVYLRLSQ